MTPTASAVALPGIYPTLQTSSANGKVIIDATKPPLCAGEQARPPFQRLKPMGWETVRLEDFLPK